MLGQMSDLFPEETAILGRILAGYTELEFSLLCCIEAAHGDLDTPLKIMFRTRGETQRLEIGDAIGRKKFHELSINTDFEMAIGAMHHCLKIRNQYSHCHWYLSAKTLIFVDLEEAAKKHTAITVTTSFTTHVLTLELLKQQEAYFDYAAGYLYWLDQEANAKRGTIKKNDYPKPKQLARPPLYTLPG